MVLSSFLPFVGYFYFLADLSPWGLDTGPVTLTITCGLLYYGIFHCGVFDLAPLARTLIFNTIRDAVLILDTRNRLLDFNPAAAAAFPVLNKDGIGSDIEVLFVANEGLAVALSEVESPIEFEIVTGEDSRYFEIRTWPLFSESLAFGSGRLGRAVILADVTAQVQLREELRRRAETDPLTGVANRRRFHQALEIECARFARGRAPLSLLMIDLDHFKEINDRYGHPAGDVVIFSIAQRLSVSLRKTDLLARYGGEEFSILLPETRIEGARVIAERIREAVFRTPVEVDGELIPISVSVGVASHATDKEVSAEILLKKADLALYRAKATGRNRVEVI
jgi:diguanylate cyclase (GGDEF)-like protein